MLPPRAGHSGKTEVIACEPFEAVVCFENPSISSSMKGSP